MNDERDNRKREQIGQPLDVGMGFQMETQQAFALQGIGWAVKNMQHGLKVRRRGWNGRGMWLAIQTPDLNFKMSHPYVYMSTADGYLVPWLCSQTDLLATDWEAATV